MRVVQLATRSWFVIVPRLQTTCIWFISSRTGGVARPLSHAKGRTWSGITPIVL